MKRLLITIGMLPWVSTSLAQTPMADCPHHMATAAQRSADTDQQQQSPNPNAEMPAGLSDAQRAQYLNGEGMGLAKPAEMNHYPGPRHVLQNAERMKLSPEQLASTQKLFDAVQQEAKKLGREIVNREDELVRVFSSQTADEARVKQLTAEIATLQGELRAVHLVAHLRERSLLSPEQVRIYEEARDYVPGEKPAPPTHPH